MALKTNLKDVLAAIVNNDGNIFDDHTCSSANPQGSTRKIVAIAQHGDDIVSLYPDTYFCLNGLYLSESGQPRLSRASVGGVVDSRGTADLQKAVDTYNESLMFASTSRVTELTYL